MGIRENIIALRTRYNLTQDELAKIAGVSRGAVSQWEGGFTEPRMGAVEMMAEYFGIRKSDIIEDGGMYAVYRDSDYTEVPLLGSIAAGQPIDMDASDDSFPIPDAIARKHPHSFLLHVDGDSMNRRIPNGSLALIDIDEVEPDGHSAYAVCVNGYSATIKRVRELANGYELIPDSHDPTQRPIVFDYGVDGTDEVTVIGKVVWATMPFDYEI